MNKEQFLKMQEDLQKRIYPWKIAVEIETTADFIIGCFYDTNESKWKVYVNGERGMRGIRLVTRSEEKAFDKLYKIISFYIKNQKYV